MINLLDEASLVNHVEQFLAKTLPSASVDPVRLHAAMRYAVLNPGKRLRPLLVYVTGMTLGAESADLDLAAAAVEFIHVYSLIHDDLPAMDNDDFRRGKPTCHKVFDVATAILAGDALQSFAFYLLTQFNPASVAADQALRLIRLLGEATGSQGMAGGQMFDIMSPHGIGSEADLRQLHMMKTGALIRASILMGVYLSPRHDKQTELQLTHFADRIGLAFQIQDDILDVEGVSEDLGKTAGSDQRLAKVTYPSLLGLDVAKQRVLDLLEEALSALQDLDIDTQGLQQLARRMVKRDR